MCNELSSGTGIFVYDDAVLLEDALHVAKEHVVVVVHLCELSCAAIISRIGLLSWYLAMTGRRARIDAMQHMSHC